MPRLWPNGGRLGGIRLLRGRNGALGWRGRDANLELAHMRLILVVAAMAASMGAAHAQDTAPPPSACGEIPAAPTPPNGARANAEQIRAAVAQYEAWNASASTILQCRAQEVRALRAQADARVVEHEAALAAGATAGAAWQTQLDAFQARQNRR